MTPEEIARFNELHRRNIAAEPHADLLRIGVSAETVEALWAVLQAREKAMLQADIAAEQASITTKQAKLAALEAKP